MSFCITNQLQEASFRGVSFWVRTDKENYGRRIITHEYPMRDEHTNEDLGEKAQTFHVTGYVFGDDAQSQKEAVVSACRRRGPALLQLPAKNAFMAVCNTCSVSRSKDEIGAFELNFEFTAEPMSGGAPTPAPVFAGLISSVATDVLIGALTNVFAATYQPSNVLQYVTTNAQMRVIGFADRVLALMADAPAAVSQDAATEAITAAIGMAQNAAVIAQPSPNASPPEAVVNTIAEVISNISNALAPDAAMIVFENLATYAVAEAVGPSGAARYGAHGLLPSVGISGSFVSIGDETFLPTPAPSELADGANAAAFNGAVRSLALVAFAKAVASTKFASRRDALRVRANLVELFDQQLQRTLDETVIGALLDARDYAVKALTQSITSIIPVVTVSATRSMPSIYWAYRLYKDATRATELADRNRVPTPAYMPQEFEALTP
jgi:prophage DNA circulation protein